MVRYFIGPCGFAQELAAVPVAVVAYTVPVFLFHVINDVGCLVMRYVHVLLGYDDGSGRTARQHVSNQRKSGPFHYGSKGDHQ